MAWPVRATVAGMTLVVLVLLAAAFGHRIGRWWATAIAPAAGAACALVLNATGGDPADSPIAFVAVASTVAVAAGVALARHSARAAL
jgi:hypothetical protein